MASFHDQCIEYFGSDNLYTILGCSSDVSDSVLKKSYYKKSLKVHPDTNRTDSKEVATQKFQLLSKIYSSLSDSERRKIYDETGSIDEEAFTLNDDFASWNEYWRLLFPRVTKEEISGFEKKYKNSESERNDIKNAYERYGGCMGSILETVMLADYTDEQRIRDVIQDMIDKGEIAALDAFTKESESARNKRKRKYERETKEFERDIKKSKRSKKQQDNLGELTAALALSRQQRANSMDSMLDHLMGKYCNKTATKNTKSNKGKGKK